MPIALQFSGGKDSLAILYLNRHRLHELTVYFGDTGHVYPHMRQFVVDTCKKLGATLKIVTPPVSIEAYQAAHGLPSDIVPTEVSPQMQPFLKDKAEVRLQSSLTCCANMLWLPMQRALAADHITNVIRGSKKCDGHVGVPDGHIENGVTYHSPLWNWSDADVFNYLREVGAELPEHYEASNNSADCIFCTAFLCHEGARERLEWTKEKYPELWPTLKTRLNMVREVIDGEREKVDDALRVGD